MSEIRVGLADGYHPGYPKFRWVEQAFQDLGHETVRIQSASDLATEDCDLILFSQNIPFDRRELAEASKSCPWAIWIFDLLGHEVGDLLLTTTEWQRFDYTFCKNPAVLVGTGARCVAWLDQGAPPWEPPPKERKYDVLIPGRWRKSRQEIAERLQHEGFNFVTAGPGWNQTGFDWLGNAATDEQLQKLFGYARVVVCDSYKNLPWYWSDRIWMALAGGAAYVGPEVVGMSNSRAVLLYETIDEMPETVRLALAADRYDEAIRQARENSYASRVQEMLGRIAEVSHDLCLS